MREGNGFLKTSSPTVVKNRNSSGCLVVRKKGFDGSTSRGDAVGISGRGKTFDYGERNKRRRAELNESRSSDELSSPVSHSLNRDERRVFNGFCSERKRTRVGGLDSNEFDRNGLETLNRKLVNDSGVRGRRLSGSLIQSAYEMGLNFAARGKASFLNSWPDEINEEERYRYPIERFPEKNQLKDRIRVQGKNGVLKVMVNKRISVCSRGFVGIHNGKESAFHNKVLIEKDSLKKNPSALSNNHRDSKIAAKEKQFGESTNAKLTAWKPEAIAEAGSLEHTSSKIKLEKDGGNSFLRQPTQMKTHSVLATDSEESDTSMKTRQKRGICSSEKVTPNQNHSQNGYVKRGSGTEKQKLRGRIKQMLLDSGWSIDYRPRKNRDYLDAVYISPAGTAYWSIIKAYEAFRKKQNDDDPESKSADEESAFVGVPDELLHQLTRRTKKKMEKEIKKKLKENNAKENLAILPVRKLTTGLQEDESSDSKGQKPYEFKVSKRSNGTVSSSVSPDGDCSSHRKRNTQANLFSMSNVLPKERIRKLGRCTLLVRGLGDGQYSGSDDFVPYPGKRTILSWLIECQIVQSGQKVLYMNDKHSTLEGSITADGIHCSCCSKILSASKFEIHAGSKFNKPFQNICLESGVSLLECQSNAWNHLKALNKIGVHWVDVDSGDPNDDTCCLCGDGGDLLCCDGCPSTFHQNCLNIKTVPSGDWRCPNCVCIHCGVVLGNPTPCGKSVNSSSITCSFCAKKCHISCIPEKHYHLKSAYMRSSGYCSSKCKELSKKLRRCLGVKHELEGGFSWSLIHRVDSESKIELTQLVENNSKLAIASLLMDECFLPIIDRRSDINIIPNVIFNCGSNFNRLNFSNFYTVILEKGDDMISAASLRFHGTRLAEMPFIGTRYAHRRQGMCHRLMNAIESLLKTMAIERLVIPSIANAMFTWKEVFGFKPISSSLFQEIKSFNVLVFPGLDVLEKQLSFIEDNSYSGGLKASEETLSEDSVSENNTSGEEIP